MKKYIAGLGLVAGSFLAGQASALGVVTSSDGSALAGSILGSGISASGISFTGAATAAGFFTGGLASGIGIDSGIILTSGDASLAPGPNTGDAATGNNGLAGDASLNALISGTTFDATVLEFDFVSTGGDLYFNYVFASDEYNEYTNSSFNDVFAFFLDGVNIALIPGTSTPVSINTVNGGNPYGTGASNPGYFNNNDPSDGGPFFDLQYDGFTDVFTAYALGLSAGTHHIKLAIADTSDYILDSAVFIQAGSFSDKPTPVPVPGTLALFGIGMLAMRSWRKREAG